MTKFLELKIFEKNHAGSGSEKNHFGSTTLRSTKKIMKLLLCLRRIRYVGRYWHRIYLTYSSKTMNTLFFM